MRRQDILDNNFTDVFKNYPFLQEANQVNFITINVYSCIHCICHFQLVRELERITGIKLQTTLQKWNEQWAESVIQQAKFEALSRSAITSALDTICSLGNFIYIKYMYLHVS